MIREKTLAEHGEKQVIELDSSATINHAITRFKTSGYEANAAFLVVKQPGQGFGVMRVSSLGEMLVRAGPAAPLSELPIPPATRTEPLNTPESGAELVDWVRSQPGAATLVVYDDTGAFAGLFARLTLEGGILDDLALDSLPGELADLSQNPHMQPRERVEAPLCPICDVRAYEKFLPDRKIWVCRNCGNRRGET
jgi:hypothetical protein